MARQRARFTSLVAVAALGAAGVVAACHFSGDTGAQSDSCSATAAFFQACAASPSCGAAAQADCAKISGSLSTSTLDDVIYCGSYWPSCEGGAVFSRPCLVDDAAAPTALQLQLASDVCQACAPTSSSCADHFFDVTGTGTSSAVLVASDAIVQSVIASCVPSLAADAGTLACTTAFEACARGIVTAGLDIPAACVGEAGLFDPPAGG